MTIYWVNTKQQTYNHIECLEDLIQICLTTPHAGLETIDELKLTTFRTYNGSFAIYRGRQYRVSFDGLIKYIVINQEKTMVDLNRIQKQITQATLDDTSPLAHGWALAYRNKNLGNQPVFTQGNAKLMYHLGYGCWYVQIGDSFAEPVEGNIKEVTEQVKEMLK